MAQPTFGFDAAPFESSVQATERESQNDHDYPVAGFLRSDTPAQRFRHSGWRHIRRKINDALVRTGQTTSRILSFQNCGCGAYLMQNEHNPKEFKVAGSNCHDRFCLHCAKLRGRCIANALANHFDGKVVRFLTLTRKHNEKPLKIQLKELYACFAKLRRAKLWSKKVDGGAAFCELKKSTRSGQWHPHLHILCVGRFLPQQDLRRLWYKITGDSFVVDVRLARNRGDVIGYVTSYVTKAYSTSFVHDEASLDEAITALKGRKLCLTFGNARGLKLTVDPEAGHWTNLGSFEGWVRRAIDGDREAVRIIDSIDSQYLTNELIHFARNGPKPAAYDPEANNVQMLLPPVKTCFSY